MDFLELIEAVRFGLTELMACTDDGLELNTDFYGWTVLDPSRQNRPRELSEKVFNTAIIAGLVNTQAANVQKIGCARVPNHVAFTNNGV